MSWLLTLDFWLIPIKSGFFYRGDVGVKFLETNVWISWTLSVTGSALWKGSIVAVYRKGL